MTETSATTKAATADLEFECPQFADFATETIDGVTEEFCQQYFDKKAEEIKRKSDEFDKENIREQLGDVSLDPSEDEEEHAHDSDPLPNLISPAEFNTSSMSICSKSTSSSSHNRLRCSSRSNRGREKHLIASTEERQLIELREKQRAHDRLKERNAKNVAKMKDDHRVFQPTRSTKLTIPVTPALHTTVRARQRMRHYPVARPKTVHHPTTKKRKHLTARQPIVQSSHSKKHKPLGAAVGSATSCSGGSVGGVLSTEAKQLREMKENGQFHARKLNPKLFAANAANSGILNNIKNKPSTTTVKPFNFLTEKRAKKHHDLHS